MTTRSCCVVLVAFGSLLAGCGDERPTDCWADGGVCEVGDACRDDSDCASGVCTEEVCEEAPACTTHADCAEGTYCVQRMVDGGTETACSETCGEDEVLVPDETRAFVCIDGAVMDCGTPEEYQEGVQCNVCGCPEGNYCIDEVFACGEGTPCSCRPKKPFGESCLVHQDCESNNCSGTSEEPMRWCQRAAGESCDPGAMHCQWCWEEAPGDFQCKQSCARDSDCPDGGHCLGGDVENVLACWADCTPDGPPCADGYACVQISDEDYACLPAAP